MIETIKCHCGATVEYDNPSTGSINIGHFQHLTGWKVVWNTFNSGSLSTCPKCLAKAQSVARELTTIFGTSYISVTSILKGNTNELC